MNVSVKPSSQCSTQPRSTTLLNGKTVDRRAPPHKNVLNQQTHSEDDPTGSIRTASESRSTKGRLIDIPSAQSTNASGDTDESLQRRIDQIATVIDNQKQLNEEILQRDLEINDLRNQLSDLRLSLFQEKEHALSLCTENDRLQARELINQHKIQQLLKLSGLSPNEISYFLREPAGDSTENQSSFLKNTPIPLEGVVEYTPTGETIVRKTVRGFTNAPPNNGPIKESPCNCSTMSRLDYEAVTCEIELMKANFLSLRTQLTEQLQLARGQMDSLLNEKRGILKDAENVRKRCDEKLRVTQEQITRLQTLLRDTTDDLLAQRQQFRQAERAWKVEKEKLLVQLRTCNSSQAHVHRQDSPQCVTFGSKTSAPPEAKQNLDSHTLAEASGRSTERTQNQTLRSLEERLSEQQKLAEMYRKQVLELEDELVRSRAETTLSKDAMKQQSDKLTERLNLISKRYRELEGRRQLERQGHRADVELLRKKLEVVEKQFLQLSLGGCHNDEYGTSPLHDMELTLLRQVRNSSAKSTRLMGELKNMKLKMYTLEDELRKI